MRRFLRFSRVTFIPARAFGLGTGALYHVGHVVPDLEAAMAQFSDAIGARWVDHIVHARHLDEHDQQVDTDLHSSFSLDGSVHIELIEAAPGTAPVGSCPVGSEAQLPGPARRPLSGIDVGEAPR